jgi:hypothetical protein
MPHPRYSSEEIAQRGQRLYEQKIQSQLAESETGKFLALDIETGQYEIDADELAALKRAKAKNPDAALYLIRVGSETAYKLGTQGVVLRP